MNRALFLDRDGTINIDKGHVYRIEDFEFISGIPEFIKQYNNKEYKVIVITNQAGIAKGYFTAEDVNKLHKHINEELNKIGAHIDAFYMCPHHPDYTGVCNCRKPKTGMIERAIKEFNINVSQSILYGDKPWDIECGLRCGIKSYYIDTVLSDFKNKIS
ncbi:D-glycero-alpha-D-manno-heptose-1,7-bisphosphate 7-phosphatase [Pectinatus haikarae]|uniref:D-glycero-alpha-D-manno-heptose-1,7-bisphosphate 7-phosphatase n=1 Tax=Pectinatus haikarae TaxID=349096 RepID=UPI0018C769E4|nr:HAD family hydrolase [Pectinatus haikarae]